ncbi:MAG: hypothetical protein ACE5G9_14210 [Nitrospinales bacterium]
MNAKMPRFIDSRGSFTSFSGSGFGFAWANSMRASATCANAISTGADSSESGGPHSAADESTAPPMVMTIDRTPIAKIL